MYQVVFILFVNMLFPSYYVTKLHDRVWGKRVTQAEIHDLNTMMEYSELSEMDSRGHYFTWSNNQMESTIYSRIDRVIANTDRFQLQLDATFHIMNPGVSDHAMLWVNNQETAQQVKPHFKFINCVVEMER